MSAARRSTIRVLAGAAGALSLACLVLNTSALQAAPRSNQVETVPSSQENYVWVNVGNVEGHLTLNSSPAGAFSPDGSALALVNQDKIVV